jgi:signal transduction histidine kinase
MSDCVLRLLEHERSRISRDLHEQIAQALMIISMNLGALRNNLGPASADTEQRINETQHIVEQTMINVHNFSRELRPAMLDDLGLVPTLRNYAKHFTERTGLPIRLDVTQAESIERLDEERKTVIYRVIQEGLENVAKHAQASHVDIVIAGSEKGVRLQLGDDGQGFAAQSAPGSAPQLGLLGLAERVRLVGGEFAITSLPEQGTLLRATISF